VDIQVITRMEIEFAPKPNRHYLNDQTAFDTYIEFLSPIGDKCGIGIEVKYTEKSYKIGVTERGNVENKDSKYWILTKNSGIFDGSKFDRLIVDDMRQIWRNHLLGISMIDNKLHKEFLSVVLYLSGNIHFAEVVPAYKPLLTDSSKDSMRGLPFDEYIASLHGFSPEIKDWKDYLYKRYIVR
jgi:hypothetical protein